MRVHFQLEQDRLVQTHDVCTAELISDLHKMTLKYRKERGMFDVVRKSKDAVIANLKQEHSDEIIKIKKEDDTMRYNLEKENTIIKALQYNVHALHLEELKKRDKAMRDKDKQFQVAKLCLVELREKNKREKKEEAKMETARVRELKKTG